MPAQRWVDRLPARGGDTSWACKGSGSDGVRLCRGGWKLKEGTQLEGFGCGQCRMSKGDGQGKTWEDLSLGEPSLLRLCELHFRVIYFE